MLERVCERYIKNLVLKPEGDIEKHGVNIKMHFKETDSQCELVLSGSEYRISAGCCEKCN